jgi:hypothetical protein
VPIPTTTCLPDACRRCRDDIHNTKVYDRFPTSDIVDIDEDNKYERSKVTNDD